jgi:hypothetical protein
MCRPACLATRHLTWAGAAELAQCLFADCDTVRAQMSWDFIQRAANTGPMNAHAICWPETRSVARANNVLSIWCDEDIGEQVQRASRMRTPILKHPHASLPRVDHKEVELAGPSGLQLDAQRVNFFCIEELRRLCKQPPPRLAEPADLACAVRESRRASEQRARHCCSVPAALAAGAATAAARTFLLSPHLAGATHIRRARDGRGLLVGFDGGGGQGNFSARGERAGRAGTGG